MTENKNKEIDWGKILLIIAVLIALWKFMEYRKQNMVDDIMSDPETMEELGVDTREEAEELVEEGWLEN